MSNQKQAPIKAAQDALMRGDMALTQVLPAAINTILDESLWRERTDAHGERFSCFRDFVEHPFWEGLNVQPYERLADFCKDDKDLLAKLMTSSHRKPGRPSKPLINDKRFSPTSEARTLERLQREYVELYDRVKGGELSAHAAAIEAGFRRPTRSIPIDTPKNAVAALLRVFTKKQISNALDEVSA